MNEKQFSRNANPGTSIEKLAVIGLSDGLIIAFAVATALYALGKRSEQIIYFSSIAAVLTGIIIGIGGYLSAKFRMESLAAKTVEEEERLKREETEQTIALFKKLGIGDEMQEQAANEIEKDSAEWKRFLQQNEQSFEVPDKKELPWAGLMIGLSFLAGAVPPIAIYWIITETNKAFQISLLLNAVLMLVVGCIKSNVNREAVLAGGFRLLLLGGAAAGAAYFVAGIFN
ncbi:MAG: hypothetical protein EOO06_15815 [Chitinophagaceae bacterium]|nr:MAG: hypothetical protein EOO06_15815 [Chitinophagaceae bacterium]